MELLFYFVFKFFEYILRPYSVVVLFPPPSRVESRGCFASSCPPIVFRMGCEHDDIPFDPLTDSTRKTGLEKLPLCNNFLCVCIICRQQPQQSAAVDNDDDDDVVYDAATRIPPLAQAARAPSQ